MQQLASGAQQSLQGPENEDNLADFGAAASRNILFVDGPAESIVLAHSTVAHNAHAPIGYMHACVFLHDCTSRVQLYSTRMRG